MFNKGCSYLNNELDAIKMINLMKKMRTFVNVMLNPKQKMLLKF